MDKNLKKMDKILKKMDKNVKKIEVDKNFQNVSIEGEFSMKNNVKFMFYC